MFDFLMGLGYFNDQLMDLNEYISIKDDISVIILLIFSCPVNLSEDLSE